MCVEFVASAHRCFDQSGHMYFDQKRSFPHRNDSIGFFMIGQSDAFLSDYQTDLKLHSTK